MKPCTLEARREEEKEKRRPTNLESNERVWYRWDGKVRVVEENEIGW